MGSQPLKGIKVIELTTFGAGPSSSRVLADWGADVIKVEPPTGDPGRYGDANTGVPNANGTGPLWEVTHANKRSIAIDLKREEGRELIDRLIAGADVFLSSNRLKALKKMGLDYETLSAKYPRLVWAHVSGWGSTGPMANEPAFDTVAYWARSGQLVDYMEKDTAPLVPPLAVADYTIGPVMAGGIAAALYKQKTTGEGSRVSASLYGLAVWATGCMNLGTQFGYEMPRSRKTSPPTNNTYCCKDGEWILITSFNWAQFPILCRLWGLEEFINDPRFATDKLGLANAPEIIPLIDKAMITRTSAEWAELLRENDIPCTILRHIKDIIHDEQALMNQYVYPFKSRNGDDCYLPAPPVQYDGPVAPEHRAGPLLGENTDSILADWGYSDEEIKNLRDQKVVF